MGDKKEPIYKCGKIYREHFDENGNERKPAATPGSEPLALSEQIEDKPSGDHAQQHFSFTEAKVTASDSLSDTEEGILFNTRPISPNDAFPASLASAVNAACIGTEAHPMAVALHYVIYFAAHIGQHRYVKIGNEKCGLNLYGLLVGRTGKVKGTAEAQVLCIEQEATQRLIAKYGYIPPRRRSGLSSGEGLIQAIRDPEEDNQDDQCLQDKRLMVTESEYANVLTQDLRAGNTLSIVLRDAFDGKTLENSTINPRIASNPHICIIGHITPEELKTHKAFGRQSANGALNRNLIIYGNRGQYKPSPRSYSDAELTDLPDWFANSIIRARDHKTHDDVSDEKAGKEVRMSAEAKAVIDAEYEPREREQDAMPELLANLLSRQRVFVRILSALFSLLDDLDEIQAEHVNQAYRWVDYSADSIRYLLNTAGEEARQVVVNSFAEKVYEAICSIDQNNRGKGASRTAIRDYFNRNRSGKEVSTALKKLLEEVPPRIELMDVTKKGRGAKPEIYRPTTKRP
ncbi:DUF3987 domain-containing protein [Endozoicomonas sp. ALB115]|uniref:DUF3987 domain-containing protein n=1 Tax=Endozoicomonas sp. ALB115 TaxID=3403074 RepID=UPI003BB4BCD0